MSVFASILSTGRYVPERCVTNRELEQQLGQSVDTWLVENVGIRQRHFMADHQVTSDLAVEASRQALDRAGLSPLDLDRIIVATDTPDYLSPATSAVVQYKLGASRAGVFDVNSACTSFVSALDQACRTVMTDPWCQRILVVGAYGMSRFIDWTDKSTCTLFADGAGAVVVGRSDQPGFLSSSLRADGSFHDALGIYTGGTYRPATPDVVALGGAPHVQFVRKFPRTFNLEQWPATIHESLSRADLSLDAVSLVLFTQLNLRTIESAMAVMGLPLSRTHWIMDQWGYTGSACLPMVLDHAVEKGLLHKGDVVVLCASGGGIALAVATLRWGY